MALGRQDPLMSKVKLITIILALCMAFTSVVAQAADSQKIVTYYVSENGKFQERLRWVMNNNEEWNRFEAFSSRFRNSNHQFSPLDKTSAQTTPDMIVISDQNTNLGTGRDYYLTPTGMTVAERAPKYRFFRDQKGFYDFLKLQQKSSAQLTPKSKLRKPTSPITGLHIIYQISHELSNPSWDVTNEKDLSVYYDFFKGQQEVKDNNKSLQNMNSMFDQKNTFLIQILPPNAEYDVVAVAPEYIRFSKPTVSYRYLVDEKNYYQFYRIRALDNIKNAIKAKQNDRERLKSQF